MLLICFFSLLVLVVVFLRAYQGHSTHNTDVIQLCYVLEMREKMWRKVEKVSTLHFILETRWESYDIEVYDQRYLEKEEKGLLVLVIYANLNAS